MTLLLIYYLISFNLPLIFIISINLYPTSKNYNLGDISKVDDLGRLKNNVDLIVGGSPCFVAGTKVFTSNGYVNIEDLQVGDTVLTHNNRFKPIIKIGGQESETVTLKAQGILPTETTMNHPYYIRTKNPSTGKLSEPTWKNVEDLKKGDYIGIHIPTTEENPYDLSEEDCWLLGRYVADGHYRNEKRAGRKDSRYYQVIYSIGDEKIDKFKECVKETHFSCYKHGQSIHRCVVSSKRLVTLIKQMSFGDSAKNKRIPNEILNLPVGLANKFLDGYISGDGCLIDNKYSATTISEDLALGLCLLVAKCKKTDSGIYFNKTDDKTVICGREVNQSDTYIVRFFKERKRKGLALVSEGVVWLPFTERIEHMSVTQVFNISVKDDESYTANNAIVHNCQDFSISGKQQGSTFKCLDCEHEFNPLVIHHTKRDECPNCNSSNLEKTRSSLLIEYLRTVREIKPKYLVYENVKNIVGKKFKSAFDLFETELQEYGYNTYWQVLNAKDYGVPQNRERVFVVGIRKDIDDMKFEFPKGFDNGLRLRDLLDNNVDESYYIAQDKVDKLLEDLKNKDSLLLDVSQAKREGKPREYSEYAPTLNARDYKEPRLINETGKIFQIGMLDIKGNEQIRRVYDSGGLAPTLNTMQGGNRQPKVICAERGRYDKNGKIQQQLEIQSNGNSNALTTVQKDNMVLESKRLDVDNKSFIIDDTQGFDGVRLYDEYAPTLRSQRQGLKTITNYRIRKLIPLECWRLMGFSDDDYYISKQALESEFYNGKDRSNSQMYKMAGNSICVNVLEEIFKNLFLIGEIENEKPL